MLPDQIRTQMADILSQAPVNVNEVARRLGLAVYERVLAAGISGALVRDASYGTSSGFVIFVATGENYRRQRFTAAHECGHFVLHRDHIGEGVQDNYLLRSGMSDWLEAQANAFAADLLMPRELIGKLIQSGVTGVGALADALKVSEIAMGIRLGHPT